MGKIGETLVFKKRRGLGELGNLVMTVLVAIMLVTAGTVFYAGVLTDNGIATGNNVTNGTGATDAFSSLNSSVQSMGETLKSNQNAPAGGLFYVMFNGALQAVQILFATIGIMTAFVFGTGGYFGTIIGVEVSWVIGLAAGIFVVYIVWRLLEGGTGRPW